MMKRISKIMLSIVLMLVMSVSAVFADMNSIMFDLESLGVLYDIEDTTTMYTYMTRGEFAQLVVNALGYNESAKAMENVSYFTDCATSPYLGAINLLYEFNIISGAGDGKFNPDAYLTYPQVGKFMVNALGYSSIVRNTDLSSYYYLASTIGVYDNTNSAGEYVTRRDGFIIIDNSLDVDLMTQNFGMFGTGSFEVVEGNSLKSYLATAQHHRLTKKNGVVTADCVTYLYNGMAKNKTNLIEIDGAVYKCNFDVPRGLVGVSVDFYVEYTDGENGVITAINPTKENTVVEFALEDFNGTSDGAVKYLVNDKDVKIKYDGSTKMVYNNRRDHSITPESIGNFKDGTVRAIDNNEDEIYDVIYITSYTDAIVEKVYTETKQVFFANNQVVYGARYISLDDEDVIVSIVDGEGNVLSLENIAEDNVISIAKSKDNEVITVVVSDKKVTGTIKVIEDEYVTIDTDVYMCAEGVTTEVGKHVDAYINFRNEIVYLDETVSYDNYAYVLNTSGASNSFKDTKVSLITPGYISEKSENSFTEEGASSTSKKLFFRNGGKEIYPLASKVVVNGERYSDAEAVKLILNKIISYTVNADGKISKADTIDPYDNDVYKTYNENGKVFSKGSKDGFGIDDSKTMSICIPEDKENASDDDLMVPVMLLNMTEYKIKAYDVDETSSMAGLVVVTEKMQAGLSGNVTTESPVGIVKKVSSKIEKDEEKLVVNILTKDGEKNYFVSNLIPNPNSFATIGAGDLIAYSLVEGNDELNGFSIIQDANGFSGNFLEQPYQPNEACLGAVVDLRYDYVSRTKVRWTDGMRVNYGGATQGYEVYNTGTPPIFLLEGKNEIKKLTFDEIQIGDKVFVSANLGVVRAIVVRR